MNRASADRNLLLALLALQTNLIDPTAIVAAFNAWTRDKARSMGEIFVDQGVIDSAQCEVLELLVDVHVRKHAGDVEKSLAAIGSSDVALLSLGAIADPDLGASLAAVGIRREQDISDTRTYLAPPAAPSRRFKILRLHARGGLGEVFVASDEELHREVALKQIQDAHADEADSRFRFVVEAEITGGLEHPGIVPVYGLGHYDDGRPYYAMRFIRGESLREAIKKFHQAEGSNRDPGARSLALRQLLRRFLDVCNAVAYAHSRGVLHRDLKPSNVMLGPYGETLVVDWGLAKVIGRSEVVSDELTLRPPSGSDVQATRAGVAIGTLSYMSPEQARGDLDRLGPASDVYSLGATLYHVLTGREPFSGGDAADLQAKVIVGDYPPPRQVLASIPAAMEAVCIKAMAREAGARYSSPRALADDVEHWMADEPVSAWREPWATRLARWGRRHRSAVAVAAGVLVVAALGLYIARLRVDRARTAAALEQEETQHYVNRFVLAEREWQAVNVRRAEQLLDECPQTRRGWEWRYLKRLCHQDLRTIAGHTDDVWCVSVSPDGNWIASASLDKTVRLWDARSFQCVPTLQHPLQVYNVAFSPDGRHLASIAAVPSQPGEVTIWDVGTGAKLKVLPAQNGIAGYVAFSPDGRRLASTSGEREGTHEVVVWDLATDEKVVTFAGHDDAVNAVAFSPDGQRIASASGNQDYTAVEKKLGVVHVWDAASGAVLSTFRGHTDSIIGLAFRPPDGRQIASASWDRTVKLWDAATAAEVRTFRGHTHFVDGVVFRHDGRQLASSGEDGAVKLWDADTGLEMRTFRGHTGVVQSLAYSPDGTRLYSASYDRTLKVWDTAGSGDAGSLGGFNWWINSVAYSADGDRLAAAGGVDRSVKVWDPKSTRETLRLDALPGPAWGVAFSPDRRRLAAALGDWRVTDRPGVVKVWDAADGRELLSLAAHQGVAWCVAFSPDGRLLASSGGEARTPDVVTLWDVATGREIHSLRGHQGGIRVVAFSPDGKSLASASEEVKIWEVRSGREIRTLRGQTGAFSALAYSPDGRRVASGGSDAIVRIWDVATGREIFHLQGHTHQVFGLAFHPNDNRLASGSFDGTVKLWDTAIGQEILTLRGNAGAILSVAFSPDGQQLASGGYDKNVKIWDATPLEDPNSP